MDRGGHPILGALAGALWGAGVAVLVQQLGLWPLDAALAYGGPLVAATLSGLWGRRGGRRVAASAALLAALAPLGTVAFQPATCEVVISAGDDATSLADTSPTEPFVVDPAVAGSIVVDVQEAGFEDRRGEVWVEFGGIRTSGVVDAVAGTYEIELDDNGVAPLGGSPGIYHVGGEVPGVCSADGFIRVVGNPFRGPVGLAASAALILGLAGTWWAGRPQKPIPPRPAATPRLQPGGEPLHVGGIELQSPGLDGQVELHPPTEATLRTIAGMTDHTLDALAGHHLRPEQVIEISDTAEHPAARTERAIDTHHGEPAFQIDLPRPPPGHGQVILASDESGAVTWHLPRLASGLVDTTAEWATRTYRLARWVAPRLEPPWMRSLVRAFGSKIITSLTFPLLDPLLGEVGERFARRWETSRRPYRLRTFTPNDYARAEAGEPDWDRLAGGRALLFVHGTFARAHTAFAGFTPDVIEDLHGLYEGRLFAFDHFTLSDDPRQNVAWFFEHLPPGLELRLDIVCHSRGGLVSRVLAERAEELGTTGSRVAVDKIVFAGTPNAGTVLAEPAYVGDLIDSYTNLLNFLPGQQAVDALEGVITVVKQVAVGAAGGLAGLQSMRPGGPFLAWLNAPADNPSRYFAMAGDYVPPLQGWRHYAVDHLMDRVFDEPNDLVVPTAGTWDDNGSSHFPISLRHEFRGAEGVNHTGYFASKQARDQLLEWLQD